MAALRTWSLRCILTARWNQPDRDHIIVGGMMLAAESSIMSQREQARNLDWPSAPRSFQSCRPNVRRSDRLR
jgi:hypothetical protein